MLNFSTQQPPKYENWIEIHLTLIYTSLLRTIDHHDNLPPHPGNNFFPTLTFTADSLPALFSVSRTHQLLRTCVIQLLTTIPETIGHGSQPADKIVLALSGRLSGPKVGRAAEFRAVNVSKSRICGTWKSGFSRLWSEAADRRRCRWTWLTSSSTSVYVYLSPTCLVS